MSELLERIEADQNLDLGELAALMGLTKAQLRKKLEAAAAARATEEKVARAIAPLAALRQAEGKLPATARRMLDRDDAIEKEFEQHPVAAQEFAKGERTGHRMAMLELAVGLGLVEAEVKHPVVREALRNLANAENLPRPAARGSRQRGRRAVRVSEGGLAMLRFLATGRKTIEQCKAERGTRALLPLKAQERAGLVDWCDGGTWGLTAAGQAVVEAAQEGNDGDG